MTSSYNIVKKYLNYIIRGGHFMKKNSITIRSSAAEYLTYIAAIGTDKETIEVRYEHENI